MSLSLPTVAIEPLRIPIRNTPASLYNPGYVPPRSLLAQFNWATDYGAGSAKPDVNVLVNVQAGGAQQPIDFIRSVKIDNLGNSFPVYVYFLDTTDTIVAPPDTIVWEPVVTNSRVANVILQGAQTAGLGNTKVYFCNFFVPPYVDPAVNRVVPQWIGSPTIQRSNILTPGFGPPALGDQTESHLGTMGGGTGVFVNNLFGSPYSTGFIYLTHISVKVLLATAAMLTVNKWQLEGDDPLFQFQYAWQNATNPDRYPIPADVLTLNAMNIRLDATQTWALRCTVASAVITTTHIFNFTYSLT